MQTNTNEVQKTVTERAHQVIAEQLGVAPADLKAESHITNDLGADSLDHIELVMALEDEFEMEIPDEEAEKANTVGEIVAYLEQRVASR